MKKEKVLDIRKLTTIGVLGAISVVLGMTPLGFIPVGPTRATIMHIPVIIGAIMAGPLVGGFIGLIFGLFSIFQAITAPTPVSFVFINPIVSVLPRVLIGLVSHYVYKGLKNIGNTNIRLLVNLLWFSIISYLSYGIYKNIVDFQGLLIIMVNIVLLLLTFIFAYFTSIKTKDKSLDVIIATIVGSLTNTSLVLFFIYLMYAEKFVGKLGLDVANARKVILGIGISNGIPETIIAIIIVGSVVNILKKK